MSHRRGRAPGAPAASLDAELPGHGRRSPQAPRGRARPRAPSAVRHGRAAPPLAGAVRGAGPRARSARSLAGRAARVGCARRCGAPVPSGPIPERHSRPDGERALPAAGSLPTAASPEPFRPLLPTPWVVQTPCRFRPCPGRRCCPVMSHNALRSGPTGKTPGLAKCVTCSRQCLVLLGTAHRAPHRCAVGMAPARPGGGT